MFLKELEGKKVRYYKKYKIEGTKDYKQFSCTLVGKTRAVQAEAERILDQMHADWLGVRDLVLDVTVGVAFKEYLVYRESEVKRSTFLRQKQIIVKLEQEWSSHLLVNPTTPKIKKCFNKQKWSKRYRGLVRAVFKSFFKFCVDMLVRALYEIYQRKSY